MSAQKDLIKTDTPTVADLSRMSVADLRELQSKLKVLAATGDYIEQGIKATFDLTPGRNVKITLDWQMPAFEPDIAAEGDDWDIEPEGELELVTITAFDICQPQDATAESEPAVEAETTPDPVAPETVPEPAPEMTPGPEPVAAVAEPEPIAVPDPAPVAEPESDQAAKAPGWTADEDELAISLAAKLMVAGQNMSGAAREVAIRLGRPEPGTLWRMRNKLNDAIQSRVLALTKPIDSAPEPRPVAAAEPARTAVSHSDPILSHLAQRPMKGGWTDARDRQVLELAELDWKAHEIAAELFPEVTDREVLERFKVLTNNRAFKRADVLAALQKQINAVQAAE